VRDSIDATGGDQRVGALGFRAAGNERQLANLVAAESKRNGIVSL
jgi:hypothetical protein